MSKKDEHIDPRILRTRKMMLDSLVSLIIEKGFDAVSVKDIADRAMVNRTTFYNHYEDKSDLLERGMEEVLDNLRDLDSSPNPDPETALRDEPPQALNTYVSSSNCPSSRCQTPRFPARPWTVKKSPAVWI